MRVRKYQFFADEGGTDTGGTAGAGGTGMNFSQIEEFANARAERATKAALKDYFSKQGMSEDEVNSAIEAYKEQKKKAAPDVDKITRERDEARAEVTRMKNQGIMRDEGVKSQFLDFVHFEVAKKVDDKTDFKSALKAYLKEHPEYTGETEKKSGYRVKTGAGSSKQGESGGKNADVNDALRRAFSK